jgi:hypothetical protein
MLSARTAEATRSPASLTALSTRLAQLEFLDVTVCRQKTASRKNFSTPSLQTYLHEGRRALEAKTALDGEVPGYFAYANNNPLTRIDPTGLAAGCCEAPSTPDLAKSCADCLAAHANCMNALDICDNGLCYGCAEQDDCPACVPFPPPLDPNCPTCTCTDYLSGCEPRNGPKDLPKPLPERCHYKHPWPIGGIPGNAWRCVYLCPDGGKYCTYADNGQCDGQDRRQDDLDPCDTVPVASPRINKFPRPIF